MIRRPPRSTRTDTLFPYTTLFRSRVRSAGSLHAGRIVLCQALAKSGTAPARSFSRRVRPVGQAPYQCGGSARKEATVFQGSRTTTMKRVHGSRAKSGAAPAAAQELSLTIVLRSEEHTSEHQSLMRSSNAVFCVEEKKKGGGLNADKRTSRRPDTRDA